ncbi:MAG: AEC family transporter [Verrucomicrobiales bacterium]
MGSFPAILVATLPVFFIIGLGAWFRNIGWWPEEADRPLIRLVINAFYPCLIAHHVLGNPILKDMGNLAWSAGVGFTIPLVCFAIGLLVARLLGLKRGSGAHTFAVSSGIQNYGFLPIPIIAALFTGEEATRLLGILFMHNLGLEIAVWTIGVALLRGNIGNPCNHLVNTPIVTIVVCTVLTLTETTQLIPAPFHGAFDLLGNAAIPISLFLVGASLYSVHGETEWRNTWKTPLAACGLRFLVFPGIFLAAALMLPINIELQSNLIIQGTMPAGAFVVVLARHYGGHASTAGQIVIATSLVGLVAIPTLLTLGFRWIH